MLNPLSPKFRLVHTSIIDFFHCCVLDFDRLLSCLLDTSFCSFFPFDILLFQPMTPPRDTCFSDLLLTAESIDNGRIKAAHSDVDIVVRSVEKNN